MSKRSSCTLWAALLLGGGALVYLMKHSAAAKAAGAAGSMLSPGGSSSSSSALAPIDVSASYELPGSSAPTASAISSSSSFWGTLTPTAAITSGYINFPSGSQAAAADFFPRMDSAGNYYVQWAGLVYELGFMDAQGNWPATLVGAS